MSIVMILGNIDPQTHHVEPNFHIAYIVLINTLTFAATYQFNFKLVRSKPPLSRLLLIGPVGTLLIASSVAIGGYYLEKLYYGAGCTSHSLYLSIILQDTAGYVAYLVVLLIAGIVGQQQMAISYEHLQAENLRIKYESLEKQISPHFLFNSLNTLDGLIGNDDPTAHLYLRHMSDTFRYTMQPQSTVTLEQEMDFTHAYTEMMLTRYGKSLQIDEHIAPEMQQRMVPPISVQLLIENAIKHNVVSLRHPLNISILAPCTIEQALHHQHPTSSIGDASNTEASLVVINPKHPKSDYDHSAGVGLTNLIGRYRLLFNKEITISNDEQVFAVEIPLI